MAEHVAHTTCVVLSEHLSNHYVGPLVRGALAAAAELGARVLLYSPLSIYLDRRDFTAADLPLLPRSADSYLVPANLSDEVIAACRQTGATLLSYAGGRAGLPMIGPDNRAGARAATAHLIGHGRRRIAHLAGLPDSVEAAERLAGYREALAAAGLPFEPALVVYGHFRSQEAEAAVEGLIAEGPPFDAIFAANDLEARGALHALARAGLRVPDDVALAGFDDMAGSDILDPPLTTVRQSAFQLGWDALALLARSGRGPLPALTATPVQLVVRQSCGCAPAARAAGGWAEQLVARFGSGQAPLLTAADVRAWVAPLEEALAGGADPGPALAAALERIEGRGAYAPALRDYLELWRARRVAAGADPAAALARAAAAKDALAALLERRALGESLERSSRLNAITYVLDLLRVYNYEHFVEPVLRYMVESGPSAAISLQRGAAPGAAVAQRVSAGAVEQWQGPTADFPPAHWLAPGEAMLLMPMMAGAQQHMLFGVIEGQGRAHIDLDDQLLRAINTYRAVMVLNETLRELDAARSVQLSLLPRAAPVSERYDIAGATMAARQVGGDLYGYYARGGGELAIALGDVAGKGLPAALLMSACATALAGTVWRGLPPAHTLAQIHQMLMPSVGPGQNAAICLAFLDGPAVRIANAGAVAPMLLGAGGVRVVEVGGLPLGTPLSGLLPYAEVELRLAPGDVLILSSDGIVEAMSEAGEIYGFERFLASIARSPGASAQQILDHLLAEVAAFAGEAERHDDMALVVARYLG